MANGLFNMPSPEAVRQQARQGLFKQAAQIAQAPAGRGFVQQAAQAGGLFGEAIGRAAGGQLPGEQQAQAFQEIQNQIGQEFVNKDLADPRVQVVMMGKTANMLQQAGMSSQAAQAMQMANQIRGSLPVAVEDEALKEIRKETRGSLRPEVKKIVKEASVLETNWNKLQNLTKEISAGNRAAVPAAMVALVKIGDPGSIVSEKEMEAAMNAKNPVAALGDLLQRKGVKGGVFDSIMQRIDTLNPDLVNVNDLLATAQASISANVPSLQQRFASADEIAQENLTEAGVRSIFAKGMRDTMSGLSGLLKETPREAKKAPTTEATVAPKGVPAELWNVMTPEEKAAWQ